ncbi:MAG: hypothetical protein ABR532_00790 [Candidatus Dormibacteria bacterium]
MARGDAIIGGIVFTPADQETLRLIRDEPYAARCARLAERLCLSHNGAKKRLDHLRLQTGTSSVNELLEWVWRNGEAIDRVFADNVPPDPAGETGTRPGPGSVLDPDAETAGLPVASPPCDDGDDMDRRAFLEDAGKLTGALVSIACLQSVELGRSLEASDVGPATLEQLDATVERFEREYFARPLPELMAEVQIWRQYVARLLQGRHTLSQRRHLYGVAGWLSALLGSLAFDLGHESAARAHRATALHLAAEADDGRLTAWVRGSQAAMAVYIGEYPQAVEFAMAGLEAAPATEVGVVRLCWQEARGHARMGDAAGFEHAVGCATQAFDRLVSQPDPGVFSFAAADFPYYGATCYVWLDEPRRAMDEAEQAIRVFDAAPTDWPAARVIGRLDLAMALLQLRQVEDASTVGGEALNLYASGRRSHNIDLRAAELRSALQGHTDLPAVRELNERFEVVCGEARPR